MSVYRIVIPEVNINPPPTKKEKSTNIKKITIPSRE